MEPTWSSLWTAFPLPTTAIRGGHLYIPTYVGRAELNGLHLAASITANRSAFIAWDGKVHRKTHFDVLTGDCYKWRTVHSDEIPENAVKCCDSPEEGPLYIGRALHKESLLVGTIHARNKCLVTAYENKEIQLKSYEILIYDKNPTWYKATYEDIPLDGIIAGHDTDGAVIYVGRAKHLDEFLPAKVIPSKTCCYVVEGDSEVYIPEFELLCGSDYTWRKPMIIGMPVNAVYADISKDGVPRFIGRGNYKGSLTPGLIDPLERCLFLPYGGKAVRLEEYEVLVKQ